MLEQVKHVILVLSGKGGVGKSTVSTQLALALCEHNFKVGILDIDLCGPSVPYLLGVENAEIYQSTEGWLPVKVGTGDRLSIMSISFLLKSRNDPIIWRGPKKTSMIKQFLQDIVWPDLDYLIVDTPPGTSDEHITVMECMRSVPTCDGALIITTPQQVALDDVRKEITFCKKTGIAIIGIVENMSGFVCPHCQHCTNIFSSSGGMELAKHAQVNYLAALPIDPRVAQLVGTNRSIITELKDSSIANVYEQLVANITSMPQKT